MSRDVTGAIGPSRQDRPVEGHRRSHRTIHAAVLETRRATAGDRADGRNGQPTTWTTEGDE